MTEGAVLAVGDGARDANDALAARGHVVVTLEDERVVFLRAVLGGSVTYVAPCVSTVAGETPGHTARRAALEHLGLDVEIADLVFADTEHGAEHFYFLARPLTSPPAIDAATPDSATSMAALTRSALLAYPIRPIGLALRLRSAARTPRLSG